MTEAGKSLCIIRSFVLREGRVTSAQLRALKDLWPRFGVKMGDAPIDFTSLFERSAPVILEIGFGNGEALLAAAKAHPENNYFGIEVYRPGAGSLLRKLDAAGLTNVRIMLADAKEVLADQIPDESIVAVHLFFPDPWPKKRHHKRRLVQPDFAALIARKLRPGGYINLATDWQEYAEHIASVLSCTPGLEEVKSDSPILSLAGYRPLTKFEQRGKKLGHTVWDHVFQRTFLVTSE